MTHEKRDELEEAARGFPDLDDAARQRAAARVAAGTDAHAALAHEAVLEHLVRVYN